MMATLIEHAFDRAGWLWEPKLDGVRALAYIHDGKVELRSRRGLDCTKQYPALGADLARQPHQPIVLDGEICALDEAGVPHFQLLQPRINLSRAHDIARMDAEPADCLLRLRHPVRRRVGPARGSIDRAQAHSVRLPRAS